MRRNLTAFSQPSMALSILIYHTVKWVATDRQFQSYATPHRGPCMPQSRNEIFDVVVGSQRGMGRAVKQTNHHHGVVLGTCDGTRAQRRWWKNWSVRLRNWSEWRTARNPLCQRQETQDNFSFDCDGAILEIGGLTICIIYHGLLKLHLFPGLFKWQSASVCRAEVFLTGSLARETDALSSSKPEGLLGGRAS
jgi:hypothetical protein